MDFSSANVSLWSPVIQIGIISGLVLLANVLRRKIPFIRKSLMPTAVIAGFLMLILRSTGILKFDTNFLEMLTYHALGIGFIAMALKVPESKELSEPMVGSKSGALIVSTYCVQGIVGLAISIILALTFMPDLFLAAGILLPMAYGQGPGQANNVGSTYEALGMQSGRTFGLSLAAMGYLCACIVGVIFLNIYAKRGRVKRAADNPELSGSVSLGTFQDNNEIPISESVDKFSIQALLVIFVYYLTYGITLGITTLIGLISEGLAGTVSTLLWGFNFIIGSLIATAVRSSFKGLRKLKIMNHQYQNNYLLSRISGLAFDIMIVAGIASIELSDLSGMWIPFILMAVAGGIVTYFYIKWLAKKLYPTYEDEAFFSMYGMLTGTVSSGMLLLREIDPDFKTPASNNLVVGSSFGIAFGAPILLLISLAAKGGAMTYLTFALLVVYLVVLLSFMLFVKPKKYRTKINTKTEDN